MDHSLRRWYDIQTDNVPDEDDLESDREQSDEAKQMRDRRVKKKPATNKPQTPSESRTRMRAPSLTALELMAVADRSLFEHHMSQIGLPVIGRRNNDPTEKEVQSESISSIASAITEDVNDSIQLNDYQKTAKKIAEDHGYIIKIS